MKKHGMLLNFFRYLACGLCLLLSAALAHAEDSAVVRLSFVDGNVQASAGKSATAIGAVINMPLFEGSVVTTATDGQAEIEFADGSVARLTPNSSLELTHLQPIGPTGHTDLTLVSGLAYFELNVGQGQRFTVKMGPATLRPIENSIFRVGLDTAPDVAVMQGTIHVESRLDGAPNTSGLDTDVSTNQDLRVDPADMSQYTLNQGVPADSWDQWNQDRDAAIAQMSASQTAVRDDSQAPADPGWNDLDYYGNWYPVEGYGNVWTPSDVGADWDPFGYGYWGDYSGYGTTWISGYPWGWLPYHCGAWNYFPFGWGWVPGGCGLGWSPVVTVWNTPPGYRLPGWPKAPGSKGLGIVPSQHRPPLGGRLIPIDRGPGARGPWANGPGSNKANSGSILMHNRGLTETAKPLQVEGNTVQPLPRVANAFVSSPSDRVLVNSGPHVGVPVSTNAYRLSRPAGEQPLGYGGLRNNMEPGLGSGQPRPIGRSTYTPTVPARAAAPPPAPRAAPAPPSAPAPRAH